MDASIVIVPVAVFVGIAARDVYVKRGHSLAEFRFWGGWVVVALGLVMVTGGLIDPTERVMIGVGVCVVVVGGAISILSRSRHHDPGP